MHRVPVEGVGDSARLEYVGFEPVGRPVGDHDVVHRPGERPDGPGTRRRGVAERAADECPRIHELDVGHDAIAHRRVACAQGARQPPDEPGAHGIARHRDEQTFEGVGRSGGAGQPLGQWADEHLETIAHDELDTHGSALASVGLDQGGTPAIAALTYVDTGAQALFHRFDVGDGADHPTRGVQLLKRLDGVVEGVGVERTEALVDEQGFEHSTAPGATLADDIGKPERKRQRGLEALAARQGGWLPWFPGVRIEHHQVEPSLCPPVPGGVDSQQFVATLRHALEVHGGVSSDPFELTGEHPTLEAHAMAVGT